MRRSGLGSGLLLALTLALAALPARAGCAPGPGIEVPLRVENRGAFVPMTIDGGRANFLLDTGAERTIITVDAAKRLKLEAHYTYGRSISGFAGGVGTGEVQPRQVGMGGVPLSGFFALVGAITLPPVGGAPADGLLGADILDGYDLDLDLAGERLTLHPPLACAVPSLPWREPAHAAPARLSLQRHLVFDVQIGGQTLPAFIDTGAQRSLIGIDAAARLGVGAAALSGDPAFTVRGVGGAGSVRAHRFAGLAVAGLAWAAPVLLVAPLRLDDADIILGADFLEMHRVWLAYGARLVLVAERG